jgi:hypothetical protein
LLYFNVRNISVVILQPQEFSPMSSLSITPSPTPAAFGSSYPVTFGKATPQAVASLSSSTPDSTKFSGKRQEPQRPPQKSAFQKYAWPGTLMATGLFLGLTTGFGIPIIGHLAGLVMLGWGANKAWTEFRGAPASSPAYSSFENEEDDDEMPPSYEASTQQPEMHEANHSSCPNCTHNKTQKTNKPSDES